MANLPATTNGSSNGLSRRDRKIIRLLLRGWTIDELAERLAPKEVKPKQHRAVKRYVYRLVATSIEIQEELAASAQGALILAMPEITEALARRAVKGNVPAAKLAMEASGFHNPRVKHEHTGDIKVTIANVPRPPVVEDDGVVDAQVVED